MLKTVTVRIWPCVNVPLVVFDVSSKNKVVASIDMVGQIREFHDSVEDGVVVFDANKHVLFTLPGWHSNDLLDALDVIQSQLPKPFFQRIISTLCSLIHEPVVYYDAIDNEWEHDD